MIYILRTLILVMSIGVLLTLAAAFGWIEFNIHHIRMAIPCYLFVLFTQAFVMFYFIGTNRFTGNIYQILESQKNMDELFDEKPTDLAPYKKKVRQYFYQTSMSKRQVVPWSILMIFLGMLAFLLGGAHDTGMVAKTTHVGLVYGFLAAMVIGIVRQWINLRKNHQVLREIKTLFEIPHNSM